MVFDNLKIAAAFNSCDNIGDILNNNTCKEYMDFEKKNWPDHTYKEYVSDNERCIEHCRNMLDGSIKEYLFAKYFNDEFDLTWRGNPGTFTNERDPNDVGKTDCYNSKGVQIEIKCFDIYKSTDEVINELTDWDLYGRRYHKADEVYCWFPFNGLLKRFYKENGQWKVERLDKECLEEMMDQYLQKKVKKIVC